MTSAWRSHGRGVARCVGGCAVLAAMLLGQPGYAQDASRKTVGIVPVVSSVTDIQADAVTEMLINALMETNRFAIKPPDANGAYTGADYVLESTISEGKAKSNVLGFLKDTVTSNLPVNLTVRVFDPRTNALVNTVTVKSTDVSAPKVSLGDVQSLMGAVGAGNAQPSDTAKLEERLGGLLQQAASRLASQLGGGAAGASRFGTARTPAVR